MNVSSAFGPLPGLLSRLRPFLALSRTPHGLLDMAAPVAAMLLWLGHFPPLGVTLLGLFTAFAGYTAVYAVNDLVDLPTDTTNAAYESGGDPQFLDAVLVRHPLAHGLVGFWPGLFWAAGWGLAALAGAWILNPVCAAILVFGVLLEVVYCLLLKVTHLRALVNGVVKTLGGLAAILAVDAHAPGWFLALWFAVFFLWEIGGQNIPADWFDMEQDRRQGARTLPVILGEERAARLAYYTLGAAVALCFVLLWTSPAGLPPFFVLLGCALAAWLTVIPARLLMLSPGREAAAHLFNRASLLPAALLLVVLAWMGVRP